MTTSRRIKTTAPDPKKGCRVVLTALGQGVGLHRMCLSRTGGYRSGRHILAEVNDSLRESRDRI